MVERLVCAHYWLRASISLSVEEDPEELAKIEEALINELGDLTISSKSKSKSVTSDTINLD